MNASFEKFHHKYTKERDAIRKVRAKMTPQISNLKKSIEEDVVLSAKLSTVWTSSPVNTKEKLQNLVFPNGIIYSKKEAFQTEKVNSFLPWLLTQKKIQGKIKKGQTG